ncbi:MAG: MmgE/PrpD family protein [Rubrivivax sp.]|nr:MmgE/PrpD family protein [Rubrivivax sp.]
MTALETLAEGGAALARRPLGALLTHHAQRAVVDWAAALLAGAVEAPARAVERALAEDLDRGRARLALGRAATARAAALVNGTAAHTVEVDDIYREAIYHPGAPTISAALAAAQDVGADGPAFLRAVTVGYELSTRIGAALGRAHYRYWHNTGTVGTFGAAAAAAALYGLDSRRFGHALATAATFAAGLQQAFRMDSMSKPLHAGRAAEAGLLATQLAREGVTGSADVLDGAAGLGRAMGDGPDWAAALATLGQVFHIEAMTFKNHACCGHTFAAIDGALALKQRMGITADDVARLQVATYRPALDVAGNLDPRTAAEARFSLPYVVATALRFDRVRLAAFADARLQDGQTRALMARIEVGVDAELDAAFPGRRAARVCMTTHDGRHDSFLQPTRKGDPELPLSDADLDDKFIELAGPVLGEPAARRVLGQLWALDQATGLDFFGA